MPVLVCLISKVHCPNAGEARDVDCRPLLATLEGNLVDAPNSACSFESSTFSGPGESAVVGAGCGKASTCRMKGNVALDFPHYLMDVAIEHGDRAETFRGSQVRGLYPAPVWIDALKGT